MLQSNDRNTHEASDGREAVKGRDVSDGREDLDVGNGSSEHKISSVRDASSGREASNMRNTTDIQESLVFESSYRAFDRDGAVRVYNSAASLDIETAVCFDREQETMSSLDHLVGALMSDVLLAIKREFAHRSEEVLDLECRATAWLSDPLVVAGVIGYDGTPHIDRIDASVYLFSFLDEGEAQKVVEQALVCALVYQTLIKSCDIRIALSFLA